MWNTVSAVVPSLRGCLEFGLECSPFSLVVEVVREAACEIVVLFVLLLQIVACD